MSGTSTSLSPPPQPPAKPPVDHNAKKTVEQLMEEMGLDEPNSGKKPKKPKKPASKPPTADSSMQQVPQSSRADGAGSSSEVPSSGSSASSRPPSKQPHGKDPKNRDPR